MFDFDVITGPGNATRPAKPATPPAMPALSSPPQAPAAAVMRDDGRDSTHPAAGPAGPRP